MPSLVSYKISIEEILKYIEDNNITNFKVIDKNGFDEKNVGNGFVSLIYDKLYKDKKITFVDNNHPFLIDHFGDILIESNFYEKYKDDILDKVKMNIEKQEYINISKHTYDEELLKKIIPNVKSIHFDRDVNISDDVKNLCKKCRTNATLYTEDGKRVLLNLYPDKYIDLTKDLKEFEKEKYLMDKKEALEKEKIISYEFIYKAGDLFVKRYGKDIKIDTIIDAMCNINKDVFNFNDEQLKIYKEDLLEKNKRHDMLSFPYYYEDNSMKMVV